MKLNHKQSQFQSFSGCFLRRKRKPKPKTLNPTYSKNTFELHLLHSIIHHCHWVFVDMVARRNNTGFFNLLSAADSGNAAGTADGSSFPIGDDLQKTSYNGMLLDLDLNVPWNDDINYTPDFSQYEFNSAPGRLADIASNGSIQFKFSPETPDIGKGAQQSHCYEIRNIFQEEGSFLEKKKKQDAVDQIGHNISELLCDETFLQYDTEFLSAASTQLKENDVLDKTEEATGMDLHKTPEVKAKRRKIRPRIVLEGRVKKTPKSNVKGKSKGSEAKKTPKSNVKEKSNVENKSGKRKYTRKNESKPSNVPSKDVVEEVTTDQVVVQSCKRKLKFQFEGTRLTLLAGSDGLLPKTCTGINCSSGTKASQQLAQGREAAVENFSAVDFDLNLSCTELSEDCISLPEKVSNCEVLQTRKTHGYHETDILKVYKRKRTDDDLIDGSNEFFVREQNAMVPYGGGGQMVAYEGLFNSIKKKLPQAKVDLHPEDDRVWKLLMGIDTSNGVEGMSEDKEEWWEEQRHIFRGRAESFIARMHLILGDRSFRKWNGSILDSVIGVYLTQNVSDHLSSSAFISLAARFPFKSTHYKEETNVLVEEPEVCTVDSNDSISWQEKMPSKLVFDQGFVAHHEPEHNIFQNESTPLTKHGNVDEMSENISKSKTSLVEEGKKTFDWDVLRKEVYRKGLKREKTKKTMDSLDWEAVRCADVGEIAKAIKERGMNNILAGRIKDFLNRLVTEHESLDLEWLRDVPPDKAKEFMLSIQGVGLKSIECVRLLTLHHLAFPVDTNVGRIAVRLGWVPLQPLPESLQLHLLEMYPMMESIQKYLWPRLCTFDQPTLYELHYQMITFGKVFCTKTKPNCNACPMRAECRHFASAFASARLALPGLEEKGILTSCSRPANQNPTAMGSPETMSVRLLEADPLSEAIFRRNECEPIIEEPDEPEVIEDECAETIESDIEDEIPLIDLKLKEFTFNLQNYMQENNLEVQESEVCKDLVAVTSQVAAIPAPKLKNVNRLRTEHQVYELDDTHHLLERMARRDPDDHCKYLLAIWTPGETAESFQPPEKCCNSQESGNLCNEKTCFSCNSIREANTKTVRGTLLIPCITAMRGSFPLNGTYFQVNEVFADHATSLEPIEVLRASIWDLPKRSVMFGTSVSTIFKGLSMKKIQQCFREGYVCVRGFDQKLRVARPLRARLHLAASKIMKNKTTSNKS